MNEIRVPVKLEVLQNSISDLQKILNNLQPNTASFKAIEKIINSMVNESQKLQAQLSKPFTNEGQFKSTNKTIDKLEESAARIQVVMNGLKFSDLKLTPDQQSSFDELNNKIIQVKSNYEDFLNKLKTGVVTNGNNRSLIEALPGKDILDANFSDISSAVDKYVLELQTKVKQAEDALNKLQSNVELARRSEILTTTGRGINKESLGEALFNKYFWQNGAGEIGFKLTGKGSGSAAFLAELEQMFHLDPGQLKDLAGKSFADINKAFQEMGQKGHLNPFEGIQKAWGKKSGQVEMDKTALADLKRDLEEYRRLQIELQTLQTTQVSPKDSATQAEVSRLEQELGKLEQRIYSTAAAGGTMRAPLDQLGSQFDYLRNQLAQTNSQFLKLQRTQTQFNQMKMAIVNFMGFNQVLNLTKRAVKEAVNHIKELDTVMNGISIVTDMSTEDLWNQVDQYSKMAQAFGTTIKGAYEVSQIYYQQGLGTNDVLTLTNETLKLAKISGLDYATTTDYMTTALRGFKMEMSEASTVVDVYSNLAAHTAVSSEELAVAMSKTASSMESVGSTFEETSAMIGTMVAVTRESAVNIGSALKSIAARYGEMKKDPLSIIDSEGEEVSFNKVDAALQSVGISLKTTDGQFRSFTDVIIELSEKWDQLESTQQRYIATQFAGNRQQSRFLALVSNKDLLKANIGFAEESEDTGTLQALKALDSIESKLNQVQVAYQQFYTTMGIENVWKGLLDGATNVINTLNSLPKAFGKLPVAALGPIMSAIQLIKSIGTTALTGIARIWIDSIGGAISETVNKAAEGGQQVGDSWSSNVLNAILGRKSQIKQAMQETVQGTTTNVSTASIKKYEGIQKETDPIKINQEYSNLYEIMSKQGEISTIVAARVQAGELNQQQAIEQTITAYQKKIEAINHEQAMTATASSRFANFATAHTKLASSMLQFGNALSLIGMAFNTSTEGGRKAASAFQFAAGAVSLFSAALKMADKTSKTIPWMAIATGILAIINSISLAYESNEEKLERLTKEAEELNNKAKEAKANARSLNISIKKLDELKEKRHESAEAAEEYQTAVDELASKFPELIAGFDEFGNIIIDTTNSEEVLAKAREKSKQATYEAAKADLEQAKLTQQTARNKIKATSLQNLSNAGASAAGEFIQQAKNIRGKLGTYQSTIIDDVSEREEVLQALLETYAASTSIGSENYIKDDNIRNQLIEDYDFLRQSQEEDKRVSLNKFKLYLEQKKETLEGLTETETSLYNLFFDDSVAKNIETGYNDAVRQLNEKISSSMASPEEIMESYTLVLQWADKAQRSGLFDEAQMKAVQDNLNNLSAELKEFGDTTAAVQGYEKLLIGAWQQSADADQEAWQQLEKSATAAAMVTKQIVLAQGREGYTDEMGRNYQRNMADFIKTLSLENLEKFNSMTTNTNQYTAQDIIKTFNLQEGTEVYQYIIDWYKEGFESTQQRLNSQLARSIGKLPLENGHYAEITREEISSVSEFYKQYYNIIFGKKYKNNISSVEEKILNDILKQHDSIQEQGYSKSAVSFGTNALALFNQIAQANTEVQDALWTLISENGFTTLEGIQKIQTGIKNNPLLQNIQIDNFLQNIVANIIPNINLEIQTATSNLLESWEDTSKELNKAIDSGVTIKEADQLIQKAKSLDVSLSLDDFKQVGDKLLLTEDAFNNYYSALNASTNQVSEEWQSYIEAATAFFNIGRSHYSQNEQRLLQAIGFDVKKYTDRDGITSEGWIELEKTLKQRQKELNDYDRAAKIAADQLLLSHRRNQGQYQINVEGPILLLEELKEIASATDLTTSELDLKKKDIKGALNEVYNSLISDVFSKGIQNININDYTGLIESDREALNTILQTGDYTDFVNKYAKLAGKSITEINDLYIQAVEKERQLEGSRQTFKDLSFINDKQFSISDSGLKELADTFHIDLRKYIELGFIKWNDQLSEYVVDWLEIDELANLRNIDGFKEKLADSLNEFLSSFIDLIKKGLSGTLSQTDFSNLSSYAKTYLHIDQLDFSETAEGLKLSQKSAIELYDALKLVDTLKARLVFDELNKSLKESNEHYNDISSIRARINELDSIVPEARSAEYEKELSLAKEILAVRSTSEDTGFSFMSNKIPGAQNNPLNYFSNWQKGYQALKNGIKTGYIDYTEFYNIITEMGNLAEQTDGITIGAGKVLKNSQDAADLIEQAARTLSVDSSGALKINLKKLAELGIDFGSAGAEMDAGVTAGIQDFAHAQVNMLDGMIQLLETIVAMEQLGDIADDGIGDKNIIEIDDIFPQIKFDQDQVVEFQINEAYTSWVDSIKNKIDKKSPNFNKDLAEATRSIKIKGITFEEILNWSPAELAGQGKEFLESYTSVLDAFYKAAKSGDYNLDNIMQSIKDVLVGTGYQGDIDVGDWHLTVHNGLVLTRDDEGYVVNGVHYNDKDSAIQATMLADLGVQPGEENAAYQAGNIGDIKGLQGTLTVGENVITVITNGKEVKYTDNEGHIANSINELIAQKFEAEQEKIGTPTINTDEGYYEKLHKWTLEHNYNIVPTLDQVEEAKLTSDQKKEIKNKTAEQLNAEWKTTDHIDFKAKYGISLEGTDSITPEQLELLKEFNSIESTDLTITTQMIAADATTQTFLDAMNGEKTAHIIVDTIHGDGSDTDALINTKIEEISESPIVQVDANVPDEEKKEVQTEIESINPTIKSNIAKPDTRPIVNATKDLNLTATVTLKPDASGLSKIPNTGAGGGGAVDDWRNFLLLDSQVRASGNLGLAKAKGTLMGELGPELVVSKGRYFIVGQAGPEMVNLADDAIVFNHLQTESLLKKGMSKGRGKAVTNERNAVSFATGNVNGGPAKASASAALSALKELRAQWQAIAGLSAKDLAGKGGGGGGGGDPKAFLKDLERWYDWLQQIAQLEKEITLEEAKRTEYQSHMVARGKEYFTSQLASLELLQEQAVVQKSLNDSQEEYFKKRLKEINEQSAFSALYGFSESGQLYYKDVYADGKSAFEWLSDLVGRNEVTGEANYTAEEQYNKLVAAGFGFAMEYDSSGNKIKQEGTDWYNTALQAFWDKIDRDKEEMQSLHDSVEDGKKKLLDLENAQNEILHEIEDNQIEVEQKVLKAIEEARQREIDELKDTKEAIENSAKEFTDGLNKQLDKERQMRDNQANADELATLQRRLNILQRSGGSASEIRDLQQQINDKQYDKYFDMQEQQIQAIQDSSDAQIERLDNQIELMEEALAYEKENGLLWADVDEILKKSSEDIVSFIQGNTSEYWSKSTTELQKVLREDLFEVDRFKQFQATVEDGIEALIMKFGTEEQKKALADKKRAEAAVKDATTNTANTENTETTSNSSSQGQKQQKYKATFTNHAGGRTDAYSVTSKEDAIKKAQDYIRNSYVELQKKHPGMPQAGLGDAMRADLASIKAIQYYSTGGYDYTTGLAMLHGTKSRPESVFNAEQTRILREQFLSNRPDSVISLLKDYREAYRGLSATTYDSIQNNSNATTIEHAEVNLNVDKLANDYDAKRAANTIMDEMLRIASKTSANNSVRR